MPEVRQTILTPDPTAEKPLGDRIQGNLNSAYQSSPIYDGTYYDEERQQYYQDNCLDAEIPSGHGITNFNLNFKGTSEDGVPDVAGNDGS